MAFSIFKKPEERMAPPKAAKVPVLPSGGSAPSSSRKPDSGGASGAAKPPVDDFDDDLESLDFTGITIEEEKDPIESAIEEAAVAFANDDAAHCEAVLKESIKSFGRQPGTEVLWLMLFDCYLATGQREVFLAMDLDYARQFEKQPPVWKGATAETVCGGGAGSTPFKGELLAANEAAFDALAQAVEKNDVVRLDLGRIKSLDASGCERLLAIIARSKKLKHPIELLGLDALIKLLDPLVKAHHREQALWFMLLECIQRQGKQEVFDELAFDFAMTFEISPPAYEAPAPSRKAALAAAAKPIAAAPSDGAFYLAGNMTGGGKIDGLEPYLSGKERPVVDMSGVLRVDFASAGALMTALMPASQSGASITLRYPSHLISALLRVVGVAALATIVEPKR